MECAHWNGNDCNFFSQSSNNRLASNSPYLFLYEKNVEDFHPMGIKIITSYDHNYITIQNCLQFMHCPKRNSIILNQNRTQPNPIMVELGKTIYYLCTIPKLKEQNREN